MSKRTIENLIKKHNITGWEAEVKVTKFGDIYIEGNVSTKCLKKLLEHSVVYLNKNRLTVLL